MPDFADNLAAAINRSGLSDAEIARRAGITPQRLFKLKSGYRDPVGRAAAVVLPLARALEIEPAELWPGDK